MSWFQTITLPGTTSIPNEDRVAVFGNQAVGGALVLDGVTTTTDMRTGCRHGTPWYVDALAEKISLHGLAAVQEGDYNPTFVLAKAISDVAALHKDCDLENVLTPQATVAIALWTSDFLATLILSDCFIMVIHKTAFVEILSDYRIEMLKKRRKILPRLLSTYRNTLDGFQTAAADPLVAFRAQVQLVPRRECAAVMLCTDGAARYVEELSLGSWHDLLKVSNELGVKEVAVRIRAAEQDTKDQPGRKKSDDLAIVHARLEQDSDRNA
jgi:hypothetical protein